MKTGMPEDAAMDFAPMRPALLRIAYRMLGSVADAEDAVQEAFLRWAKTDRDEVREPAAFLRRVVTRLCLDQLKSVRRQRETYLGPWLPEPVMEEDEVEDVTLPLMLALERLSPLERAAFLLHDVFGLGFDEVAATIQRDTAACRQLASRARKNVRQARPRFKVERARGIALAEAFFAASRSGDMQALGAILRDDISFHVDGGGKRPALMEVIQGYDVVMAQFAVLADIMARRGGAGSRLLRYGFINGLPGFVSLEADGELQTTALDVEDDRIVAIYVVRNPDKLKHLH
jgi:RNA polymerase sigma-70 factor (ECF subfamily)